MKADIAVIGGGIIGCALAEELARRGRRVVVVERGRVGAEASSAAAGILSAQMDVDQPGPFFDLCQAARRIYPRWIARVQRQSGILVGYHEDGILYVPTTKRDERIMNRRVRWQRKAGLRAERWTATELRRREPAVDGPVRCGFSFPTEGQIDNVALMRALPAACRKAGVAIQEQTLVRRLLLRHRAVQGIETDRGTVRAPIVVNSLGSWAPMGGRFPLQMPVTPARGQMLLFQGPKGLLRCAVMSERAYAVQRRDGRILVGSTIEFVGFDKGLTLTGIHGIVCGARRLISALNQCTFLDAWAGLRPATTDGLPILGSTSIDGLYAAAGHFRHGILLAPVTAQLLSEAILTGRPSGTLRPFSPLRFANP